MRNYYLYIINFLQRPRGHIPACPRGQSVPTLHDIFFDQASLTQVLSAEDETRVQTVAVHPGLLAGRRRRGRVHQSDSSRPVGTGWPGSGILGRAGDTPERPLSAQPAAPGFLVVVVKDPGKWTRPWTGYITKVPMGR